MSVAPIHWGVVGGGILGMTIAHRLAQSGHRVTLFEAADHAGGLADGWTVGGVTWDRHYHVTLLSDMKLRSLLREFDLDEDIRWVETKTGFYTDGMLYSMSNTLEFLRFPPLQLIDKLRLGATIFYASRLNNWQRLEQIPVADWLRKLSGRRTFERVWLPLLRAKLGENYRKTSAAFIWSTIARMYAARRSGLKKEMFGYVPGGYAGILRRFEQQLWAEDVDVCLNHTVREVRSFDRPVIHCVGHAEQAFDQVVLTTPSPVISQICPDLSTDEHRRHRSIQYQGIVCASALLRRPLSPYYVTNITDNGVPFTAVIEMSALVDRRQFGGSALIYLPKYVPPDDPVFDRSDDEIRGEFITAIERMYPGFSPQDVLAFRVSRVRHVFALSPLDYSRNLPPMQTSLRGVYAVNSAHIVNGTLNVNQTVALANDTVERLLLPASQAQYPLHSDTRYVKADCQLVVGS